jgi:hypothetical protein
MESIGRFFELPRQGCFLFGPRGTGKSTWLRQALPTALWLDLRLSAESAPRVLAYEEIPWHRSRSH